MDKDYFSLPFEERINYINENGRSVQIRFYKEKDLWYADVPEHTKSENVMVGNANAFLDELSKGGDEVRLTVCDLISPVPEYLLRRTSHNEYGATYEFIDSHPEAHVSVPSENICVDNIWLCNVVHTIFGDHPKYISII